MPNCKLCGEPMPAGEEMFHYHGYSGPCSKPPLPKVQEKDYIFCTTCGMQELGRHILLPETRTDLNNEVYNPIDYKCGKCKLVIVTIYVKFQPK